MSKCFYAGKITRSIFYELFGDCDTALISNKEYGDSHFFPCKNVHFTVVKIKK